MQSEEKGFNNNGQGVGISHVQYSVGHPLADPINLEHRNFEHAFLLKNQRKKLRGYNIYSLPPSERCILTCVG